MMAPEPHSPSLLVVESVADLRAGVAAARRDSRTIGFVPTMGALHAGHISLIERARSETDFVVVSIFVNPTQFGPNEDFQKYPRPRERDLEICQAAGANLVFYPSANDMYPPGYRTFVEVEGISSILEGEIRPGHFRGVATVVTKLFLLVAADRAYFGQKDYQQQLLIRVMTRELNIPTDVVTCPTSRDPDGMAMSSRNAYLSADERQRGLSLSRALRKVSTLIESGERRMDQLQSAMGHELTSNSGVKVDYAVIAHPETLEPLDQVMDGMVGLVAARVGTTRLIDNMIYTLRNEDSKH